MPIKITGNGTKHIPSLKSYIGKDANEAISQIQEISNRRDSRQNTIGAHNQK